ncbi:MAG: YdiU family protein [Hyphomicrobiales bacterium]
MPAAPADFSIRYAELPPLFHVKTALQPVQHASWLLRNERLAEELGLDAAWFRSEAALQAFTGNAPLPGADPIAMAYSGHQFGGWSPRLGDGRALLAGEWMAPDGVRRDIHLKGSGRNSFSRRGDGRAALGPMIREYIVSEAFARLGIPSTRALAVTATGETVVRQREEPGAVLTRVAKSHVRVGTFQWAATQGDAAAVAALMRFEAERNFGGLPAGENQALWFLRQVQERQARLIAQWMAVGFIHGVMNTDNMQIAGETLDFGPCAFMDAFHPKKVFSSIDEWGRYAWDQQPSMALWNLSRFAETLLPLIDTEQDAAIEKAQAALADFMPAFEVAFESLMRAKLGWHGTEEEDGAQIAAILRAMMEGGADLTLTFRHLTRHAAGESPIALTSLFNSVESAQSFLSAWQARAGAAPDVAAMRAHNPVLIPRNHRIEEAIRAAEAGDVSLAERLSRALATPYAENPVFTDLEAAPRPGEEVRMTFCGT